MSGFVLAQSFIASDLSEGRTAVKRFLRLWLPVVAAGIFAAMLYPAIARFRAEVLATSGSEWLSRAYHNPMTISSLVTDIGFSSMLIGYDGVSILQSILAPLGQRLFLPISFALNPPMWTLHGEFYGSMLVLLLASAYRHLPRFAFWVLIPLTIATTGASQLSLFVAGFILYLWREWLFARRGIAWNGAAFVLVGVGVWICIHRNVGHVFRLDAWLVRYTYLHALNDNHFQSSLGALFVFVGVTINGHFRKLLGTSPLRFLGRLSFSVYLLHFPIMLSFGCGLFALLVPYDYILAALISTVAGTILSLIAAVLMEKFVDRPAIRVSNYFARFAHGRKLSMTSELNTKGVTEIA